jgi:flagellar biosynthesis GTPase FlhF
LASQLRFEGGELEELLERVRVEVGPEARIVAANRIRQGGIAGFFAREGYEVVVDADGASNGGRASRSRRRGRAPGAGESNPSLL